MPTRKSQYEVQHINTGVNVPIVTALLVTNVSRLNPGIRGKIFSTVLTYLRSRLQAEHRTFLLHVVVPTPFLLETCTALVYQLVTSPAAM